MIGYVIGYLIGFCFGWMMATLMAAAKCHALSNSEETPEKSLSSSSPKQEVHILDAQYTHKAQN